MAIALQCCHAVLERNPKQPDALQIMGSMAMEALRTDAAIQLFQDAVAARPADPVLRNRLADALLHNDEPLAAERHLRRARPGRLW